MGVGKAAKAAPPFLTTSHDLSAKGECESMYEFFMPMARIPTATGQEKGYSKKTGTYYEPERLKAARSKLMAHLAKHCPETTFQGPLRLVVKWCFPPTGPHKSGEWKTSKPDTDNLQKVLKDCMTRLGYWKDDAQVCSEIIEKFWWDMPGIFIGIYELDREVHPHG